MIVNYKELRCREQLSYIGIISHVLMLVVNYFRFLDLEIPSSLLISMGIYTLITICYNAFNIVTKSGIVVGIIILVNIAYQTYYWDGNLILSALLTIFVIQLTIYYHKFVYKILSDIDKWKKYQK